MLIYCDSQSSRSIDRGMIKYLSKGKTGGGLVNRIINKLPYELHLPGYRYCGPGTKLHKRLKRGDPGINPLDEACKDHDIAYSKDSELGSVRQTADRALEREASIRLQSQGATFGEKAAALAVSGAMKIKRKLGMGLSKRQPSTKFSKIVGAAKKIMSRSNSSNSKTVIRAALHAAQAAVKAAGGKRKIAIPRILPISKKIGGFLPFLIPLFAALGATGSVAGGAAGIAKAVNDAKAAQEQIKENKRHNRSMEAIALGRGLHLTPYKKGFGLRLKPFRGQGLKKKNFEIRLPNRPLSIIDLISFAKQLNIPHFRGVFMNDGLPAAGPHYRETAIVNLDVLTGGGTHWVAYRKNGDSIMYFDSFGGLPPPLNLMFYFGGRPVKYNYKRYQEYDSYECGHLCLKFLAKAI